MRVYTGLDLQSDFGGRFPWRSHLLDVGGVRQAYVDEGPRDAPLTFLLLHGNPTWSYLYREHIKRLAPSYRTIAVDHVGFGRSDKPRDPEYFTLEQHISNLEKVVEACGAERIVPVVQDWGGPIGMGYATRHPDKIAGVVILNTWAFVRDPVMRLPWLFKVMVLGKGGWKRSVEKNIFVELFLARAGVHKLRGADLDPYRAPWPTPAERIGVGRFPQLIPETADTGHETWQTMAKIEDDLVKLADKPALIVWPLKDPAFKKAHLERWRRVFKRVDGPHLVPHAAHYIQEDAPDEILAHIERWATSIA